MGQSSNSAAFFCPRAQTWRDDDPDIGATLTHIEDAIGYDLSVAFREVGDTFESKTELGRRMRFIPSVLMDTDVLDPRAKAEIEVWNRTMRVRFLRTDYPDGPVSPWLGRRRPSPPGT